MPWRCGRPNEMLEGPQVVLTLSSSRRRRSSAKTWRPASPMRADRHDQRIDDDVMRRDAEIGAALDDLLGHGEADVGVLEMPVSSLEMATTGTLYFLTSGRIASSFSSSPVTELTSGRPLATFSAAFDRRRHRAIDHSGRSTRSCTISSVCASRRGSVALGSTAVTPALTSSMVAPAGGLLQRVGLDGLEIAGDHLGGELLAAGRVDPLADEQNGWSKPMITCLFSDATSV